MALQREGRSFVRRIRQFFGDVDLPWDQGAQQRATALGQRVDQVFQQRRALQPQITLAEQKQQGGGGQGQG